MDWSALNECVRGSLAGVGAQVDVEVIERPVLGGVRPDFLIRKLDGPGVVLEVKHLARHRGPHLSRQLDLMEDAVGLDVIAVVDEQWSTDPRVVTCDTLSRSLEERLDALKKDLTRDLRHRLRAARLRADLPQVFASMPFEPEFEDVYWVAIVEAAGGAGGTAHKVNEDKDSDTPIAKKIERGIKDSSVVVADLSGCNPNVFYEVGWARGIKIPVVQITRDRRKDLPFNVAGWETIAYKPGQTHVLKKDLEAVLKPLLKAARRPAEPESPRTGS